MNGAPITTQLGCLLAISKEDSGQTLLLGDFDTPSWYSGGIVVRTGGRVWIKPAGRHVLPRVWRRLWDLGELEHIEFHRGPKQPSVKMIRITLKGLQRLWDSGKEV